MQEMHGTSIDSASGAGTIEAEEMEHFMPAGSPPVDNGPSVIFKLLKAKTGEGPLESYTDHPLNFNSSKGMSRIIRGATGLIGSLDLAIVDIGVGLLEFMKPKKVPVSDMEKVSSALRTMGAYNGDQI